MRAYISAVVIAGLAIPIILHLLGGKTTPWWPDTVSLGIGFGVVAALLVSKARTDREMNRRLWNALNALGRRFGWK